MYKDNNESFIGVIAVILIIIIAASFINQSSEEQPYEYDLTGYWKSESDYLLITDDYQLYTSVYALRENKWSLKPNNVEIPLTTEKGALLGTIRMTSDEYQVIRSLKLKLDTGLAYELHYQPPKKTTLFQSTTSFSEGLIYAKILFPDGILRHIIIYSLLIVLLTIILFHKNVRFITRGKNIILLTISIITPALAAYSVYIGKYVIEGWWDPRIAGLVFSTSILIISCLLLSVPVIFYRKYKGRLKKRLQKVKYLAIAFAVIDVLGIVIGVISNIDTLAKLFT